jgi:hypothetical protein
MIPVSTKILTALNLILLVVLIIMVLHGHDHSPATQHQHHHHHDHEHTEFDRLLGVEVSGVLFIEVRNIALDALLLVDGQGMRMYKGSVGCDAGFDVQELQQIRVTSDTRLYNRWQTFFSMMTPDAQIRPVDQKESYGLDKPIGCIRIGIQSASREETVEILFGDLTVQGLNHYITRNDDETIYLIPRYFWLQTVEVIEAGLL